MGPSLPAPSVLAVAPTMCSNASPTPCGTAPLLDARRTTTAASSTQQAIFYAPTGSGQMGAQRPPTTPATNAQDAATRLMELKTVLEHKRLDAASPYHPEVWQRHLLAAGLQHKYPNIPTDLRAGFDVGIRHIAQTFAPPNRLSLYEHRAKFNKIVQTEFQRGRYVGPVTQAEVESLLGTFHMSPLSIIPKPRQPGKYRIIQNLSSPHTPLGAISSINSFIDSDQYPCMWGTFSTICLLIHRLPPGSQAAICDVKEAYRNVQLG